MKTINEKSLLIYNTPILLDYHPTLNRNLTITYYDPTKIDMADPPPPHSVPVSASRAP